MRFIDTTTRKFKELDDSDLDGIQNKYAILSHRWGEEEILYADVLDDAPEMEVRRGYDKFVGACMLARNLGFSVLWIDTCCINKTDYVELGEAINSMYRWYSTSELCIAYLADVTSVENFGKSEWFERGWTLQELIAPRTVHFYDRDWNLMGDKQSLGEDVVRATGIPKEVLSNHKLPQEYSIAQRMSWAAKRKTKRIEDRAYSLMGLFDVNMAMIYGEREKAFRRLQETIISKSTDQSIFVWDLDLDRPASEAANQGRANFGLLATSPASFARSFDVVSTGGSRKYIIDQLGISIALCLFKYSPGVTSALLEVSRGDWGSQCSILLTEVPGSQLSVRTCTSTYDSVIMFKRANLAPVNCTLPLTHLLHPSARPKIVYPGFWVRAISLENSCVKSYRMISRLYTRESDRLKLDSRLSGSAGVIQLFLLEEDELKAYGWLTLGFRIDGSPRVNFGITQLSSGHRRVLYLHELANTVLDQVDDREERVNNVLFRCQTDYFATVNPGCVQRITPSDRPEATKGLLGLRYKIQQFELSVRCQVIPTIDLMFGQATHVWAVEIHASGYMGLNKLELNLQNLYKSCQVCCLKGCTAPT